MIAKLLISASDHGVTTVTLGRAPLSSLHNEATRPAPRWQAKAERELRAYFTRRFASFSVCYEIQSLSPLTQQILKLTAKNPLRPTRSYG